MLHQFTLDGCPTSAPNEPWQINRKQPGHVLFRLLPESQGYKEAPDAALEKLECRISDWW